jgi:hypothetical protein
MRQTSDSSAPHIHTFSSHLNSSLEKNSSKTKQKQNNNNNNNNLIQFLFITELIAKWPITKTAQHRNTNNKGNYTTQNKKTKITTKVKSSAASHRPIP